MNYFDKYKKRVLGNATTMKENMINETKRDFISFLNEAPTAHLVPYTKVDELPDNVANGKELMAINDVTNNDKKAYDEKILLCKLETDIEVGSYVFWENSWWMLIFKEHPSFITHKKFIMTKCNQYFNYGYKGKVYKIPIAIVPLTLDYMAS